VRDVVARSDLYERAGKDQHAFCLRVGRSYPYDVRVLANVRDDAYWMNTMLHEFGHAVYDKYINPALPYLLRTVAHINSTEAIALMMGSLADDPGWLRSVAGIPEEEITSDLGELAGRSRDDRLVFVRWALVMYRFEQALYEDPDREDLNALWWDLVEEIQLVQRPPERDGVPTGPPSCTSPSPRSTITTTCWGTSPQPSSGTTLRRTSSGDHSTNTSSRAAIFRSLLRPRRPR
jgi:peptidyl-dipeptidase A